MYDCCTLAFSTLYTKFRNNASKILKSLLDIMSYYSNYSIFLLTGLEFLLYNKDKKKRELKKGGNDYEDFQYKWQ